MFRRLKYLPIKIREDLSFNKCMIALCETDKTGFFSETKFYIGVYSFRPPRVDRFDLIRYKVRHNIQYGLISNIYLAIRIKISQP